MLIWLSLLVPIFTTLVLFVKFKRETVWWEFGIPLVVTVLLCLGSKALVEHVQTSDTEYWSGYATRAEFYERWNERVPCTHSRYRTDSKGRSVYAGNEHAYDVSTHPPYWQVTDNNNITVQIDAPAFEVLKNKFNNCQFINLHRNFHTINGNMYLTTWPGDDLRLEPMVTRHSYENRIKASNSVFKFQDVDPKKYDLFEHPPIQNFYQQDSILGDGGMTQSVANQQLNRLNAKIGASKQVRIYILIFKDKPIEAGFEQQNYWRGGNKNEFVITIGINSQNEVQWCLPFSWTEVELLKIETRQDIAQSGTLNLEKIVQHIVPKITASFKRKNFEDFKYLTVDPPTWTVVLTFLISIGCNLGVAFWVVSNEFHDGPSFTIGRRRTQLL